LAGLRFSEKVEKPGNDFRLGGSGAQQINALESPPNKRSSAKASRESVHHDHVRLKILKGDFSERLTHHHNFGGFGKLFHATLWFRKALRWIQTALRIRVREHPAPEKKGC
jgi:hypothetical protein